MILRSLAAVGLLALSAAAPPAEPGRLPAGVTPIHYDIRIDPDAAALTFKGQETVTIAVARATRTIVLNAAELGIGGVRLDGAVAPAAIATDEAAQTLTLTFARPVAPGTHRLSIGWSGKINQSAAGLFAVDYDDRRGPQRMLVTQLEASDGRRFAPMWDEPAAKASFTLSAYAPKGQTAFSNMPAASSVSQPGGGTLTTFQPTPKMASYLLFLGLGDVERRTTMSGGTEIGVITRRGAGDQGDYALASAKRILAYYNDYFGTPYPLPKLDMIAAPGSSQFFSAMENWGAILYFDRAVLVDPKVSTETDRQEVFNTVAHEMAHQWFGDLVTMRWWDDLWLNEGFASWMAGKVSNDLNPTWHVDEQDIGGGKQGAMSLDSRSGTHPIVQRITSVDQINQAFDAITYQKGQAVIRMLEGALTPDVFRTGVRSYMARHKYGSTVTDDLWREMALAAGRPVKPFMDSFTLQAGVPLIRAAAPACIGGNTTVALAQARFATDKATDVAQRWLVPVDLSAGGGRAQPVVSGAAAKPARVAGCGPLVVNPGQFGYYRTLYADGHFAALARAFPRLALADQMGLMTDAYHLANAGYAPIERMLGLFDAIPADADPLLWRYAANRLGNYDASLRGDPARAAFRARAMRLLDPQFRRVGLVPARGEAPAISQLREGLIDVLGDMGDPQVVAGARKLVEGGIDDIPAGVRDPVTAVYIRNATSEQWERLRKMAAAETNPLAREGLYRRLGNVEDPALAQRALDLALTGEASVPNRANLISGVASAHPDLAFDWAVAHRAAVQALIEASARAQFIPRLAASSNDAAVAGRLEAFVARTVPEADRLGATSIVAGIRYAAEVKARNAAALAAWGRAG